MQTEFSARLDSLRTAVLNAGIAPLAAPYPGFTLFLSVSDGPRRAEVVQASGESPAAAWDLAAAALREVMARKKLGGRWLRADWVTSAETLTVGRLKRRLTQFKRNYFRFGLAFDTQFRVAFLEQELNANAMLYGGSKIAHAVVNQGNIAVYARRRFGPQCTIDLADAAEVHVLSTEGLFCDEDGAVHRLPGPGRNAGRRHIERLSIGEIEALIRDSSNYLSRQVREDGRFVYGYHPCFDREIGAYNALRHASTAYSMIEAWEITRDPALMDSITRALAYLRETLIRTVTLPDGTRAAFVVDAGGEIKLGANAVAILALTKLATLTGSTADHGLMEKLALGIRHMQNPADGSFTHVLNFPDLSVKAPYRIIYYEGEAAFGLMRLYDLTRDERWLETVEKAFGHFIAADHWQHHDHWLSYCVNELTRHRPDERYFRFGIQNIAGYLDFVLERITTFPTLLELMMAGREMLERIRAMSQMHHLLDEIDLDKFQRALEHRAHYLLNGHFWPEIAMFFARPESIAGSFFIRHHAFRVRIDDVEHYLSGFVAYLKYRAGQTDARPRQAFSDRVEEMVELERPLIGIMRAVGAPGTRTKATACVGASRGLSLAFFRPQDVNVEQRSINALVFENGAFRPKTIGYPLVIDNDEASRSHRQVWQSLERRCVMTTPVLGGKVGTIGRLRESGTFTNLLIPDMIVTDCASLLRFMEIHGTTVIKPVRGSQGKLVSVIQREGDLFTGLIGHEKLGVDEEGFRQLVEKQFLGGRYLAQKFISSRTSAGLPFDIRLHLQRGEKSAWRTTKIYARIGQGSTVTSNLAGGGSIADGWAFVRGQFPEKAQHIWEQLQDIARNFPPAFQKLYDTQIDALGVDIGLDSDGKPWLFEVNSYPGSKFFEFEEAMIRVPYLQHLASQVKSDQAQADVPSTATGPSPRPRLREVISAVNPEATVLQSLSEAKLDQSVNALAIDMSRPVGRGTVAILQGTGRFGVNAGYISRHRDSLLAVFGENDHCPVPDVPYVRVSSNLDALMQSATSRRQSFAGQTMAVIGSVGKTSTTHLLGHALKKLGRKLYVNGIGNVPVYIAAGLSVMPTNVDCAVFEVAGATPPDQEPIGLTSTRLIRPSVCLFTALAPAHMEKMQTLENAADCKAAAFEGLERNGVAILNRDMPFFELARARVPSHARVLTFGHHPSADARLLDGGEPGRFAVDILGYRTELPLNVAGNSFAMNALGVVAALCAKGVEPREAVDAIAGWKPLPGRGDTIEVTWNGRRITVIDDAYNANPASMEAALQRLATCQGRRIAVLGEMVELGPQAASYHDGLGALSCIEQIDLFHVLGNLYSGFWEKLASSQRGCLAVSLDELWESLSSSLQDGDTVLVKGSNSTKLHVLVRQLKTLSSA